MSISDRLSDLPLSIIHLILARVPIRCAIGTSLLSRHWRYTWTTLPHLIINCDEDDDDDEYMDEFDESTNNFISNLLLHHKGPVYKFKMSYWCSFSIDSVEEWVLCLSRNDIRELTIEIDSDGNCGANLLKSSIYLCTKLTKLKLWSFKMDPPPPAFRGFFFLTCLVLVGVKLSPEGFETLLACCPLLERLTILFFSSLDLRIRSPNLKIVQIVGYHRKLCLYAPCLNQICVELTASHFKPEDQSSICNYTNFLGGFSNLVLLAGLGYFTRYLSIGIESCHTTLVFHHLEVIKLHEVSLRDIKEISVVARLILGAPNLHKLQIKALLRREDGAPNPDISFREYFGFAPNFTLEKLKDVSLESVCDYPSGMQFVKFLLEISPVLETMKVQLVEHSPHFDNVSSEVLGFGKASRNARVTVNISPKDC